MTEPDLAPAIQALKALDRRPRVAILDDYIGAARSLADWSAVDARCDVTVLDRNLTTTDEALAALAPYDILCTMRERMPLPRALIEGLPNLKAITITGRANRTLDSEAAGERNIAILAAGAGGDASLATAELTWGLILSLARNIPMETASMRAGGWQTGLGSVVKGKTLGIIGLGRLGGHVATIAQAFGMRVLAWSQNLTAEAASAKGATLVDKATLLSEADVVSLHLVLSDRTRGIIGAADLARMKPTALLINTARGPLVDEAALIEALKAGRPAAAGIDVFETEPLPADHPLRQLPNALLTPHLGYTVRETFEAFYRKTVENVLVLLGE